MYKGFDFYKAYYNRGCVRLIHQIPINRDKKIVHKDSILKKVLNGYSNDFTKAIKSVNNKSNKHKHIYIIIEGLHRII